MPPSASCPFALTGRLTAALTDRRHRIVARSAPVFTTDRRAWSSLRACRGHEARQLAAEGRLVELHHAVTAVASKLVATRGSVNGQGSVVAMWQFGSAARSVRGMGHQVCSWAGSAKVVALPLVALQ